MPSPHCSTPTSAPFTTSARPRTASRASDLEKRFPQDTFVRFTYVPTLRALVALRSGDPARALTLLEVTEPYELGAAGVVFNASFGALYPAFVRGEAYLAQRRPAEAIREFQKILARRGLVLADPVAVRARLQIARAHILAGDSENAARAYEGLFDLWKETDADLEIVRQARAEYARLRQSA